MAEEYLYTQEGYDKLIAELDELKSVGRRRVADHLKEAISYGDLSENAEYDAAKNEQAELEERIEKLENMKRLARIISDDEASDTDKVNLGHTVKVEYLGSGKFSGEIAEYTIVGTNEADPFAGKISNESPIGGALIGAHQGAEIVVEIPDNTVHLKILEITKK